MALLVTQANSDLDSTFLECINSMDTNLGTNTYATLATAKTRAFTPSRADNITGIIALVLLDQVSTFRNFDVRLQENVSGTWTTRATATIDVQSLLPGGMYVLTGYFASPYTVDTTANKWRLSAGTTVGATENRHTFIVLETGSSGNPYLIPITSTTKTFTDDVNGILVDAGHILSIDRSVSFRGNAKNNQLTNTDVCLLLGAGSQVISTNTTPINIDFNGGILPSKTSTIKIGDPSAKVNRTNKVTLRAGTSASTASSVSLVYYTGVSSILGAMGDILLYGSPKTTATLTANASASQRNLVVNEIPVSWQAGDTIYIDMLDIQGYSSTSTERTAPYTIDSFPDANTVRLTSNLLTRRLAGATIVNASDCGIQLTRLSSIASNGFVLIQPPCVNSVVMDGVYNDRWRVEQRTTTGAYICHYGRTVIQEFKNGVQGIVGVSGFVASINLPKTGMKICDNYIQTSSVNGVSGTYNSLFKSGVIQIENNIFSQIQRSIGFGNSMNKIIFKKNKCSNSSNGDAILDINAIDSIIEDNSFYGSIIPFYNIRLANRVRMRNNYYDRVDNVYRFVGNVVNSSEYQPKYNNVLLSHAIFLGSASIDFIIDTPNEIVTVDATIADAIYGSKLRILNDNEETKNDRVLGPAGNIQRTGNDLADNTALFNYAIRFNPIFDNVEFNQLYPIGNQQGNTLSVIYKVLIPSANYWSSEHQMPTVKVIYDGGLNEVEAVMAKDNSDWINISIEFTPKTEIGVIDITLSGFSDQSAPDSYFYLGQCIVNKPDGSELKLSNLDLFYQALPITPTVATLTDFSENIRKIEGHLPVINRGVKKASVLVPHTEDL